jgi:hypothetical protein
MTASELISQYGPPDRNYQAENCMIWNIVEDLPWFSNVINSATGKPVTSIFLNKVFKDMLLKSFTAVAAAGLQGEITTFNGCYVQRDVRGSNQVSAHAYAAAIDLDAAIDGMVVNPTDDQRLGKWTKEFVDAMTSSGIFFGGYFEHRADPMHFSMADL